VVGGAICENTAMKGSSRADEKLRSSLPVWLLASESINLHAKCRAGFQKTQAFVPLRRFEEEIESALTAPGIGQGDELSGSPSVPLGPFHTSSDVQLSG